MCTQNTLKIVLDSVCERVRSVFGDSLTAVKLYGSYARGDYDEESDIDVMVIADISPDKREEYRDMLSDFIYDLDLRYGVLISLFIQDKSAYERFRDTYPFFLNVEREGMDLVA